MNKESIEAACSGFEALVPHDPLDIKQSFLPWWINLGLFEEFGVRAPLGLFKNKKALEHIEEAFKFFSERMECKIVDGEKGPAVEFEGGSFFPGREFVLKLQGLEILGNVLDLEFCVYKEGEDIACEWSDMIDPTHPEIEGMSIDFRIGRSEIVIIDGEESRRFREERLISFPGNGSTYFYFWHGSQHLPIPDEPRDRLAAIEEVKKSILWRAFQ